MAIAAFPDGRFGSRWGTGVLASAVLLWLASLPLPGGREGGIPERVFTTFDVPLALIGVAAGVGDGAAAQSKPARGAISDMIAGAGGVARRQARRIRCRPFSWFRVVRHTPPDRALKLLGDSD